jgi:hypothetical protein
MASANKNELDETMVYKLQATGPETLHSISKVMEFMTESTFVMWTAGSEHLEYCQEGLHYLLQHMTSLIKHATNECHQELENAKNGKKRLASLEALISFYRTKSSQENSEIDLATELSIKELEKILFPYTESPLKTAYGCKITEVSKEQKEHSKTSYTLPQVKSQNPVTLTYIPSSYGMY